jgi:hypothetical protein
MLEATPRPSPRALPTHASASAMETRAAIPLWHAAIGTVWLLTAAALLLWGARDIAAGRWGAPRLLGATHALTLGWLLTITVGVLHQIGPAAMGVDPRSGSAWRGLLPLLAFGTAAVVGGVVVGHDAATRTGWTAVALATLGYGVVLLGPWRATDAGRVTARRVALAFTSLGATFAIALLRLLYGTVAGASDLAALRLGHIAAGVGGFGTLLGIAIGLQLFPGFFGARELSVTWGRWAFRLTATGVVAVVGTALVAPDSPAWVDVLRRGGIATAALGGLLFAAQVIRWRRASRHETLDPTLRGAVAAASALGAGSTIALACAVHPTPPAAALTMWGLLMLPGWITILIAGVLLRVIPLMAWMERFGTADPAVKRSVKVSDLARVGAAHWVIRLLSAGVASLAFSAATGFTSLAQLGALVFLAGAGLLGAQLVVATRVARVAREARVR